MTLIYFFRKSIISEGNRALLLIFTSSLPVARQQSLYLRESLERKEVQENKLRSRFKRALKANQEIAKVVDELRASKMISNKAAASLDMFEG